MGVRRCLIVLLALTSSGMALAFNPRATVPHEQKFAKYWLREGKRSLLNVLNQKKIEKTAKNIILFLGDGMGIASVTATRIYKGQKRNKTGEEELLAFDPFPYVSLSKTYGIDKQLSDSSNTATAYLCGVKANKGTLGVDGRVMVDDCKASKDPDTHVDSILKWVQDEGKWTGLVTTTRVTHATPAGLYAHTARRRWEAASPDPDCIDIATQLVEHDPGRDINVILGGGRKVFIPESVLDVEGIPGARLDSKNLLKSWKEEKESRNRTAQIVFTVEDLRKVDVGNTDYLLGLFLSDHFPFVADRPELNKEIPTLMEMTEIAIKILSRSPKGFFLLVEGGKIDAAHHNNWAMKALEECLEFDSSVEAAVKMTDEEDTLIIVTADHSHAFMLAGGYPDRGSNILGLGGVSDIDNRTYTTVGYINGPGYRARDFNLTEDQVLQKDYMHEVAVPMSGAKHGGEDVGVYARGPMAHLFQGVQDQSYIAHAMSYAACAGPNKEDHCK